MVPISNKSSQKPKRNFEKAPENLKKNDHLKTLQETVFVLQAVLNCVAPTLPFICIFTLFLKGLPIRF